MKWKLTWQFLASIIIIVVIVLIVNTTLALLALYNSSVSQASNPGIESFTRSFEQYVAADGTITKDGQKALREKNAWIQVLNKDGDVLHNYLIPKDADLAAHYSPVDIIQMYKYQEIDGDTTMFFSEAHDYTYMIGVKNPAISRISFIMSSDTLTWIIGKFGVALLIIDVIIAIIVGFFFGNHLTKPLRTLIEGIGRLQKRQFKPIQVQKGVYKDVFHNVNDLAKTLDVYERDQQRLAQMREEWFSNISHDLKTPLASIQGYAELLNYSANDLHEKEIIEYATIIEQKSIYMKELIDDLNLTTKLRNQQFPLNIEQTNIVSFMRELTISVLNDAQFSTRSVSFDSDDSKVLATVDQKLLKRAILNFIYNALLHNHSDVHVNITVSKSYPQYFECDPKKKLSTISVCMIIQDNGKGIPANDLDNIFERYYRGTNTTNPYSTGLGMAIARDIIHAHGGQVYLQSEEHIGTTIIIAIP